MMKWYKITDKTNIRELYHPYFTDTDNEKFRKIVDKYKLVAWKRSARVYLLGKWINGDNHYNNVTRDFNYDLKNPIQKPPYDDHGAYFKSSDNNRFYIYHPYEPWNYIKDDVLIWAKKNKVKVTLLDNNFFYGSGTIAILLEKGLNTNE